MCPHQLLLLCRQTSSEDIKGEHQRLPLIPATLVAPIKAPRKYTYFSDFYLLMVFPWGVALAAVERRRKIRDLVY